MIGNEAGRQARESHRPGPDGGNSLGTSRVAQVISLAGLTPFFGLIISRIHGRILYRISSCMCNVEWELAVAAAPGSTQG